MASTRNRGNMSPTVSRVIEDFVRSLREGGTVESRVADRVERLLEEGGPPKTEEIGAALLDPFKEDPK